jgi:hypothetical protein
MYEDNAPLFGIDPKTDVLGTLDLLGLLIPWAELHPIGYKWLMIAFHNLLQGCLVVVLTDSVQSGVYIARDEKAIRECFNQSPYDFSKLPLDPHLLGCDKLLELFKETQANNPTNDLRSYNERKNFTFTNDFNKSFDELHQHRNNFIHLKPISSSMTKIELVAILQDILPFIQFLMVESGYSWRFSDGYSTFKSKQIASKLETIEHLLENLCISSQQGIENLPFELEGSKNATEVVSYLNAQPKSSNDFQDGIYTEIE